MIRTTRSIIILLFGAMLTPALADDYHPTPGTMSVATAFYDWHDDARNRDIPVKIYYPKTGIGPFPVIIFSHGLGGSRDGYAYLGEYWAAHGYVSMHIQHHGSDQGIFKNGGLRNLEQTLRNAIADPKNSTDRAQDVSFAIDQMIKLNSEKSPFQNRLDLSRIGMAGHSFGAATTLLVSGETMPTAGGKYLDPRIKASIAMSPPMFDDLRFDSIRLPVFVMTGTEDAGLPAPSTAAPPTTKLNHPAPASSSSMALIT